MNIFKRLRKERNLTQIELASKFGISRQMVGALERGANPGVELLKQFSTFYNVSCDTLLGVEFGRDSPGATAPMERSQDTPQVSSGSIA